jgi:hypothetical protein
VLRSLRLQAIVITCDRNAPRPEKIGGQDFQVWDEGYISINTAGRYPMVFNFEPKWDPPLPIKQADEIAANVAKLIDLEKKLETDAAASNAHLSR